MLQDIQISVCAFSVYFHCSPHLSPFSVVGPGYKDKALKSNRATSDSESEVFCDSLQQVEPDQVMKCMREQCGSAEAGYLQRTIGIILYLRARQLDTKKCLAPH